MCILLAIVFPVASAVPLAAQVPLATPSSRGRHGPQDYVPPSHGPPVDGDGGRPDADWVIIFRSLVAIGVVAFIVRWLKKQQEQKKKDRRPPPKVEVVPVKDYGEQHVAPRPPMLAVELCPVLDPGHQALDKSVH